MIELPHSSPSESLFAGQSATRLAAGIMIGLGLALALVSLERPLRTRLEATERLTAVGDQNWFKMPPDPSYPLAPAVYLKGEPLVPVAWKPVEIRDSRMILAGVGDNSTLRVYKTKEPAPLLEGEKEEPGINFHFLKVGPNEYLKLKRASGAK